MSNQEGPLTLDLPGLETLLRLGAELERTTARSPQGGTTWTVSVAGTVIGTVWTSRQPGLLNNLARWVHEFKGAGPMEGWDRAWGGSEEYQPHQELREYILGGIVERQSWRRSPVGRD